MFSNLIDRISQEPHILLFFHPRKTPYTFTGMGKYHWDGTRSRRSRQVTDQTSGWEQQPYNISTIPLRRTSVVLYVEFIHAHRPSPGSLSTLLFFSKLYTCKKGEGIEDPFIAYIYLCRALMAAITA